MNFNCLLFFTFIQIPRIPLAIIVAKKTIIKIQKYPLTPSLIFPLPRIFESFYYAIKLKKKYLFVLTLFVNDKLMSHMKKSQYL